MKRLILLTLLAVTFAACRQNNAPAVQSDNSEGSFAEVHGSAPRAPEDRNLYAIFGKVVAAPSSLVRQTDPGHADIYGSNGFVSGTSFGPKYQGKGFVRLQILNIDPVVQYKFAKVNDVVLIKTSDTKAAALSVDDMVNFKCRAQYEAIAPIRQNENFDSDKYGTWEFDFCRLSGPTVGAK